MTKADIVAEIARKTGIEKSAALVIVEEFTNVVRTHMTAGENVYLRGFGTFEVIERKEKPVRNISKGESYTIPAHKIPHFKPCKEFKESVR